MKRFLALIALIGLMLAGCAGAPDVPDRQQAADHNAGAGLHLLGEGRFDAALARFDRALTFDPEHAAALTGRALVYEAEGDFVAALADHRRAVAAAPESGPVRNNLGRMLCRLGRVDEALEELQTAAAAPHYRSRQVPKVNGARCALQDGRTALAEKWVDEALAVAPDFAPAYELRAELYYRQGDYAAAAADLAQIDRDWQTARTLYWAARVAQAQGDEAAAEGYRVRLRAGYPNSEYVRRSDEEEGTP